MKKGAFVIFFVLLVLSGCLPSLDAQNIILNDPRVKTFLAENPNADITIVHFTVEESVTELDTFAELCGKTLASGKELYKAELVDPTKNLKIIVYLDGSTMVVDCVRKFGQSGSVDDTTDRSSSTVQPTAPTVQSPAASTADSSQSAGAEGDSLGPMCGDGV